MMMFRNNRRITSWEAIRIKHYTDSTDGRYRDIISPVTQDEVDCCDLKRDHQCLIETDRLFSIGYIEEASRYLD